MIPKFGWQKEKRTILTVNILYELCIKNIGRSDDRNCTFYYLIPVPLICKTQNKSKETSEEASFKLSENSKVFKNEEQNMNLRIKYEKTSPSKIQDRDGGQSKNLEGPTERESLLKEKFLRLMHSDIESVPIIKDSVLKRAQNKFKVTNETSIKPSESSKESKIKEENSKSRSCSEEKIVPNSTDKLFISNESSNEKLMGVADEPSPFKLQGIS